MLLDEIQIMQVYGLYIGCDLQCPKSQSPKTNELIKMGSLDGQLYNELYWTTKEYEYCQLVLKALSKISDEDAEGLARTTYGDPKMMSWAEIGKAIISNYLHRGFDLKIQEYQFLLSKGYAVGLWVEGACGKTAIELGLAVEAK